MENVELLIRNFIKEEYQFNIDKWTPSISNENIELRENEIQKRYFHRRTSMPICYRLSGDFFDEETMQILNDKLKRFKERELFKIEKYENCQAGEILMRFIQSEIIYMCYLGDSEKHDTLLRYYIAFFVVETDEGLKILSEWRYSDNKWMYLGDLKEAVITKLGKLLEVKKFMAPVEATSLADYNSR